MHTSFDYLMKTINRNSDRILFDVEILLFLANATYTIPLESILSRLKNPFAGGSGLQTTKTTRKGKEGQETSICIQPDYRMWQTCQAVTSWIRIFVLLNDDKFIQHPLMGLFEEPCYSLWIE